ncbi:MAG: FAD-dependent oxidoreductase [Deltaproteobacteria bacterium]|nr:FAD-dependent oxidoreductase [Deltaproteobacteria bacterium]
MNILDCDVLVIGGGAAGSRAAYEAKRTHPELKVLLVAAGGFGSSGSTNLMASESLGINAPFNYMQDGDSADVFYRDIVETGGGLSDPILARMIAEDACARIDELVALGLHFDTEGERIIQRKLSGCTKARSLTCGGSTGREIVRILKGQIHRLGVDILENIRVVDLVRDDNGRVCGALAAAGQDRLLINARGVILANGGAGRIFRHNVNPPTLEGDGWSMAYRAGARLVNMEFFQVGPAVFNAPLKFIIHSHMWRLKPRLTNTLGEEFLPRYCPAGIHPAEVLDLKAMSYPFSVRTDAKYLDIAIFKEVTAGRGTPSGGVYFDVTHVDRETFLSRSPITYETLLRAGIDLARDRIEVGLVVQNFNGGILIDADGFTGVDGLYAAGEVTGGVHGADRPGGNNLIDTQVFGYRAGLAAAEYAGNTGGKPPKPGSMDETYIQPLSSREEADLQKSANLYYSNLTIVRTKKGLQEVLDFVDRHKKNPNLIVGNRMTVGSILATAAHIREESRGTHYREDFPNQNSVWDTRIVLSRSGELDSPKATRLD